MRARLLLVTSMVLLFALLAPRRALAADPVPAFESWVTDVARVLTEAERQDLEVRLDAYAKATEGHQIAVVIVPTLDNEPIEDFSYRVAQAWQVGKKGKDDGILIALAISERRFRIEVGKGLEGDLTDLESDDIIRNEVRPHTENKQNHWHDGIAAAIGAIELKLSGRIYGPAPPERPRRIEPTQHEDSKGSVLSVLLLLVFAFIILRALRGGGRGGGPPLIFFGGGGFGGGWGGGGGGGGGGGFSGGGGGSFGGGGASGDV